MTVKIEDDNESRSQVQLLHETFQDEEKIFVSEYRSIWSVSAEKFRIMQDETRSQFPGYKFEKIGFEYASRRILRGTFIVMNYSARLHRTLRTRKFQLLYRFSIHWYFGCIDWSMGDALAKVWQMIISIAIKCYDHFYWWIVFLRVLLSHYADCNEIKIRIYFYWNM